MSATERGLLAQLFGAEPSQAEIACRRIMTLYMDNDQMTSHELRCYEIAMEGLGVPPAQRRAQMQAAIELKRDRIMARRAKEVRREAAP
ncbi:hypothetical protein GTP38_11100 [Duganella sp. FT94W]|uniref:Uncharacterized protein n=1 Tax=Duganella lactea TaxID=2692173 RepID=A0ABW9V5B8_9BURK|nr:hypothetical protein [Duganella lactea]MYM34886.1 hypothetical protein [Duganella lactea]